jgi:hypothetical protein
MTRYLSTTALTFATILAATPVLAQTFVFNGSDTIVDQLTPPGGRCVPTFFNTVSFGPTDISSAGTSNLGTTTEAATFCVNSLPPTDIIDGQFTIAFRGGDSITGTFDGRSDASATPGVFVATRNLVITSGTGRFTGATGTITNIGSTTVARGVGTTIGTSTGQINASTANATGNFATAIGAPSAALGDYATAYGAFAIANGERSAALGSFAEAVGVGAVAVGDQAIASGPSATALGQLAEAVGPAATALGHNADAFGIAATAVGVRAQATAAGATALGRLAVASGATSTALGANANASFANSTAVGTGAATTAANQVTLGGAGSSVRVGDIAAGTAAQSGTLSVATVDATGTLGRNTTLLSSVAALQSASSAAGTRLDTLDGQVGTLFDLRGRDRNDFKRGIAAATAMGQASFPSAPGKTSYVLNGATFRGETAVGGSLMHRFDTDTPIALGVGFSIAGKKNNAFRAGVAGEF